MAANNPLTLYSAFEGIGIYKTTDGGATWDKLTNGLLSDGFGRIELAIGVNDPNRVYAGYHVRVQGYNGVGLYRSTNGGTSWSQFATPYPNYCTGQC